MTDMYPDRAELRRCVRRYFLDESFFASLVQIGWYAAGERVSVPQAVNLPDDATVLQVAEDPYRAGVTVVIASESFDPVPLGGEIPSGWPLDLQHRSFQIVDQQLLDLSRATVEELKALKDAVNERLYDLQKTGQHFA